MTNGQAWILVGVAAAVLALGYLATKREIDVHATVTAGEATVQYKTSLGAAAPPSPVEDSHARMLRLIEESNAAIEADDTLAVEPS